MSLLLPVPSCSVVCGSTTPFSISTPVIQPKTIWRGASSASLCRIVAHSRKKTGKDLPVAERLRDGLQREKVARCWMGETFKRGY